MDVQEDYSVTEILRQQNIARMPINSIGIAKFFPRYMARNQSSLNVLNLSPITTKTKLAAIPTANGRANTVRAGKGLLAE
jgi:hypothetical protein